MRTLAIVVAVVAIVLVAGYVFATGGRPSREPAAFITAGPVAHRGLWSDGPEAPENSLAAFDEAVRGGYAVELDVHLSADGEVMVIHDDTVDRMTDATGTVESMTAAELQALGLFEGKQTIPTLAEVLRLVNGQVPLFVEIKNPGEVGPLEDAVARQLSRYEGDVAVMSFNPYSLGRMAGVAPDVPRGQLASAFEGEDLAWYEVFLLRNLMMNWTSRPDFIAYDLAELPSLGTMIQRWRGKPLLGWTADDAEERKTAERFCDAVICNPGALE